MKDIERGIFHFYKMNIKTLLLVTIFVTLYSCEDAKKKEEMNPGTLGSVNVKIENIVYDGTDDITKLLSNDRIPYTEGRLVQQSRVVFNDDLDLVAEMTQEVAQPFKKSASVSVKPNKRAEAETLELKSDIRYKVIVYNVDGSYVTEKNYARGLESSTEALKLDGGKTYSFIVYSVNSSTELPDVVFSNPSNKTLATSSVNFNGAADFMYYRKDMTVSGDYQNYLDVVLKHKMSQIS